MKLNLLPNTISLPSAWRGDDLQHRQNEWLIHLKPGQIQELETAAQHCLSLGRDIGSIKKDDFPLSTFSEHLKKLKQKLLHGIGVEVLRGLPLAQYTPKTAATIFCGTGVHIGSARSQNAAGYILGHVRDTGANPNNPSVRIYQTHARQSFHTDSADFVALMCLKDAKEGGDSRLVSAETIYNVMHVKRSGLLSYLFDPIATDRRGEIPKCMAPFITIQPLNWHDGKLTVFYQRQYIDSAQRFDTAMRLTTTHKEALDYFDHLANDPSLHIKMRLEPGDMKFVYNHSKLDDRTSFVDWPDQENRRHLFRLWLSLLEDRALPYYFKQSYGSIEFVDRGGVTSETQLHAPLYSATSHCNIELRGRPN